MNSRLFSKRMMMIFFLIFGVYEFAYSQVSMETDLVSRFNVGSRFVLKQDISFPSAYHNGVKYITDYQKEIQIVIFPKSTLKDRFVARGTSLTVTDFQTKSGVGSWVVLKVDHPGIEFIQLAQYRPTTHIPTFADLRSAAFDYFDLVSQSEGEHPVGKTITVSGQGRSDKYNEVYLTQQSGQMNINMAIERAGKVALEKSIGQGADPKTCFQVGAAQMKYVSGISLAPKHMFPNLMVDYTEAVITLQCSLRVEK